MFEKWIVIKKQSELQVELKKYDSKQSGDKTAMIKRIIDVRRHKWLEPIEKTNTTILYLLGHA